MGAKDIMDIVNNYTAGPQDEKSYWVYRERQFGRIATRVWHEDKHTSHKQPPPQAR